MTEPNKAVSKYMAKIGKKGGETSKREIDKEAQAKMQEGRSKAKQAIK